MCPQAGTVNRGQEFGDYRESGVTTGQCLSDELLGSRSQGGQNGGFWLLHLPPGAGFHPWKPLVGPAPAWSHKYSISAGSRARGPAHENAKSTERELAPSSKARVLNQESDFSLPRESKPLHILAFKRASPNPRSTGSQWECPAVLVVHQCPQFLSAPRCPWPFRLPSLVRAKASRPCTGTQASVHPGVQGEASALQLKPAQCELPSPMSLGALPEHVCKATLSVCPRQQPPWAAPPFRKAQAA